MPEIVAKENIQHYKEKMEDEFRELTSWYKKYKYLIDSRNKIPNNKIEALIEKENSTLKEYANVINVPRTKEVLDKVINNSINRVAPFSKRDSKKGDAGFKDALIWESILLSEELDKCDFFYFFTCDNDFIKDDCKELLEKEFKEHHKKCNIEIMKIKGEFNKRENALNIVIDKHNLHKTDITKLYDEKFLLNIIKQIKCERVDIIDSKGSMINLNINYENIDDSNIEIIGVKIDNKKYDVEIKLLGLVEKENGKTKIVLNLILNIEKENNLFVLKSHNYIQGYEQEPITSINYLGNINSIAHQDYFAYNNLFSSMNIINAFKEDYLGNIKRVSDMFETTKNVNKPLFDNIERFNTSKLFELIDYKNDFNNKISNINKPKS